jgi:hypothetical protein
LAPPEEPDEVDEPEALPPVLDVDEPLDEVEVPLEEVDDPLVDVDDPELVLLVLDPPLLVPGLLPLLLPPLSPLLLPLVEPPGLPPLVELLWPPVPVLGVEPLQASHERVDATVNHAATAARGALCKAMIRSLSLSRQHSSHRTRFECVWSQL